MADEEETKPLMAGSAVIRICESRRSLGAAAAERAANLIRRTIAERGQARIMVATGNSQLDLIEALTAAQDINWKRVDVFHMDEYVGIHADNPSSFRYWIRTRVEQKVHPARVNYIAADASDLDAEIERYSRLIYVAPIDVAFVGFGENGHIAFNDPHVADVNDPVLLKRVTLDEACRRQQAGEGHFKDVDSVPQSAVTVTCPGLFGASAWICSVPELRKAEAVRNALEGPISEACPASIVRRHPNAHVYLDKDSASLLSMSLQGSRIFA
jgi:glucosamine-6-phosphate deaminase